MKLRTYSSLAAFMAHYAALRDALARRTCAPSVDPSTSDDAATLSEMERLIGDLSAADRDALHTDAAAIANGPGTGAAQRHRLRAETHLRRLLAARGLLAA